MACVHTRRQFLGAAVAAAAWVRFGADGRVCADDATGRQIFADDWSYLKRKWREDLSDPSTGRNAQALRSEIAAAIPEWRRTLPWQMVKAKMFAHLCDNVAIDVSAFDWFPTFSYWTRHTEKLHPVMVQTARRRDEVVARRFPDAGKRRCRDGSWFSYHDYDHSAPDWDDILPLGFAGMAERLKKNWRDTDFFRARQVAIDGVLRLLDRFVAQGEKNLERLKGEKVKELKAKAQRLEKQIASLRRLRTGAPLTTLDAFNFIYLFWVMSENFEGIQVRTLGNLDRLITPFYRADLAAGRTNEDEFREQMKHFWWQWGSLDNYWGQPVYFGGTKADGTTEYTEVSRIMLEIHDELALPTPKLHLKIGKSTPDWVWRQTLEMMRRQRSITFLGEEPHWRVIRSLGYSEQLAREFMVWGCYEWAIRDSANDTGGTIVNILKPVEKLLADAAAGRFAANDFDAFKRAYLARAAASVAGARDFAFENEKCLEDINPSVLFSIANAHGVTHGIDAFAGGTLHGNNSGIWLVGTGSTVDALMAVKELVYERGELTLAELGRLMAADWKDHEALRLRMLRSKRKWGNNDLEANALGSEVVKTLSAQVNGHKNSRGGVFKASGHSSRNHYHFGHTTGATPDGRHKGEELSKNISPTMGADTEGITALLGTIASLDACDLPGDFPLDAALLPASSAGEKGLQAMRTVIETYFAHGGLVIQFNVVDADTLRDAQKHPEKYENLQVRVCGWNVRWNDIPKVEQEKFILRQQQLGR